ERDSRGQEGPGHRRPDRGVDRLRDRPAGAGAGRHRRPLQLRAGAVAVPADRQAAPAGGRGRRARRHEHRAPVLAGRPAARAGLRLPRRRRPLHRLRPAGGDGGGLPRGRLGARLDGVPGVGVVLCLADARLPAAAGQPVLGRRAHLRRLRRLAGLRLDGCGQGGAGIDLPLRRPGAGRRRGAVQHRRRRSAAQHGHEVDPGQRPVRGGVGGPRPARLVGHRHRARRQGRRRAAVRLVPRHHRRDRARRRGLPRRRRV
ncbi:MAG: Enoyl-[acyl-carrier-protein] reductase [NADH], partial [uncultured Blastococcus sp.]